MAGPLQSQSLPGTSIPALAFGTFFPGSSHADSVAAVLAALQTGYRHIDTASYYGTEAAVGDAFRCSGLPRGEVCITTKMWNDMHAADDVEKSLEQSLERLGLDYVDVLLMHWPVAFSHPVEGATPTTADGKPVIDFVLSEDHSSTWKAMEKLVDRGKVKFIGVSNFSIAQLDKMLQCARIKPIMNQVEAHPLWPQDEMLAYCKANDIALMAYSPLGSQMGERSDAPMMQDWRIVSAAHKMGIDVARVLLAWGLQRGTGVVPKSLRPSRIQQNYDLTELSENALLAITRIAIDDPSRRRRYVDLSEQWGWPCFEKDT